METTMKNKIITKWHFAIGSVFLAASSSTLASTIESAINKGTSWLKALGMLVLALIALGGAWLMFSGIMAMANTGQSNVTKGQALGKTLAGLALILVPALIVVVTADLGITGGPAKVDDLFK